MNNPNEWNYTIQEISQAYDSGYHRGSQDAHAMEEIHHWRDVAVRNVIIGFLLVAIVALAWGITTCRG